MTTQTTEPDANGTGDLAASARDIASDVADKASAAAARLPDAANATGVQLGKANELIRSESDEVLAVGTSLSLGLAVGLLLGGANRLLVILALIPATAMGFTLSTGTTAARAARPRPAPARRLRADIHRPGPAVQASRAVRCPRLLCRVRALDVRNARRRGLRASAGSGVKTPRHKRLHADVFRLGDGEPSIGQILEHRRPSAVCHATCRGLASA